MILELESKDYPLVKNIVCKDFISVPLQAVLNGSNSGFVYADSLEAPETAIVYHQGDERFYFVGNPNSITFMMHFNSFLAMTIKECGENNIRDFEFMGDSPAWDEKFANIFSQYDLYQSEQKIYLYQSDQGMAAGDLHDHYVSKNIDKSLLDDPYIQDLYFAKESILPWWPDVTSYLEKETGLVVMKKDKLVGHCLLDGYSDEMMAFSIEIKDHSRRKGLGTFMANTTIQQILAKDATPYWECSEDNYPAIKLAEKSGMTLVKSYQLYGFMV